MAEGQGVFQGEWNIPSTADSRMYDGSTVNQSQGAKIYNFGPNSNTLLYALILAALVFFLVKKGRAA